MRLSKRTATKVPIKEDLMKLRPELAHAAQKVYDEWDQQDGMDEELGSGGICDQIANALADVLSSHGYDTEDGGHDGDDHAFVVIPISEGHGFSIDIPWQVYEIKHGYYEYSKKPNVTIKPTDVYVEQY